MAETAHTIHSHRSRQHGGRSRITSRCISISRVSVSDQEPFSELILVSDRCFTTCGLKMALTTVCRVWIVCVLLSGTLSLGCERLQLLQVLNTDTLDKLNEMGRHLSRQCGTERRSLESKPLDLVKLSTGIHAQDRIQIVHQTLHHLRRIYSMNLSSVTLVQATVEHFTLLLDRQLREMEVCVRKASSESRARKNATVLKYFKDLTKFLKQKGFSDCAWEITYSETRAHLQQLRLIMATISKEY